MQVLLFEENTVKYRCLLKQNKKKGERYPE